MRPWWEAAKGWAQLGSVLLAMAFLLVVCRLAGIPLEDTEGVDARDD